MFSFGHSDEAKLGQLGAYGIGLKRAIFKISEEFSMESKTLGSGFTTSLNVAQWAEHDENMEDWRIPVQYTKGTKRAKEAGTEIKFVALRDEVKMRLRDPAFLSRLESSVAQTYALFLERSVRVLVNKTIIEPWEIPIGSSDQITPGHTQFTKGEVKVRILAALAARRPEWTYDRAGRYVLCNGRVVLAADKGDLTGWGFGLPRFHSKYNGFVGAAIFTSRNPLALPWTTTKRGLNKESPVYQSAMREMTLLGKPIISFLNDMYPSEAVEEPAERKIAERVVQSDLRVLTSKGSTSFKVEKSAATRKTTVRIQYDAEVSDIEKVKKVLRQPRWGANKVGKYTFDHYLRTECAE